jgi:hypothetical protein
MAYMAGMGKKPCDDCKHKYNYRKCMVCPHKKYMIPKDHPRGIKTID